MMLLNGCKCDSVGNYVLFITTVVGLHNKRQYEQLVTAIREKQ